MRPLDRPIKADRRLRHPARQPRARGLRRQAGRPEPAASSRARARLRRRGGRARRGAAATRTGDVVVIRGEGPLGGPGMPEMLAVTAAIVGAGLGETSLWSPTGASPARRAASWSVTSRPRPRGRSDCRAFATATRCASTSEPSSMSTLSDAELKSRRRMDGPGAALRERRHGKYARHVSSASEGAVTGCAMVGGRRVGGRHGSRASGPVRRAGTSRASRCGLRFSRREAGDDHEKDRRTNHLGIPAAGGRRRRLRLSGRRHPAGLRRHDASTQSTTSSCATSRARRTWPTGTRAPRARSALHRDLRPGRDEPGHRHRHRHDGLVADRRASPGRSAAS